MAILTNTVRPYKTEATFRKRASAVKQSTKSSGLTHAHRQFAVCHRAWMELKAKLWTHRADRHCSDTAQEAFSDSCNTDYIVWRPIKGENDESSHAGHTQCTNGSGQMVEGREILEMDFGIQGLIYGKHSQQAYSPSRNLIPYVKQNTAASFVKWPSVQVNKQSWSVSGFHVKNVHMVI